MMLNLPSGSLACRCAAQVEVLVAQQSEEERRADAARAARDDAELRLEATKKVRVTVEAELQQTSQAAQAQQDAAEATLARRDAARKELEASEAR